MNNMTDIIENYINKLLQETDEDFVILKRNNVAEKFDCVPSQLNYVIKTRFTPEQGFIIESKRGGGGFIRITKITLHNNTDYIDFLITNVRNTNIENIDYFKIIKILKNDKYIGYFDYVMINDSLGQLDKLYNQLSVFNDGNQELLIKVILENKKDLFIKFLENVKYNKENR